MRGWTQARVALNAMLARCACVELGAELPARHRQALAMARTYPRRRSGSSRWRIRIRRGAVVSVAFAWLRTVTTRLESATTPAEVGGAAPCTSIVGTTTPAHGRHAPMAALQLTRRPPSRPRSASSRHASSCAACSTSTRDRPVEIELDHRFGRVSPRYRAGHRRFLRSRLRSMNKRPAASSLRNPYVVVGRSARYDHASGRRNASSVTSGSSSFSSSSINRDHGGDLGHHPCPTRGGHPDAVMTSPGSPRHARRPRAHRSRLRGRWARRPTAAHWPRP
jgi:hypothetical protein